MQEFLKAGIRAQIVPHRIDFQVYQPKLMTIESTIEHPESVVFLAEHGIECCCAAWQAARLPQRILLNLANLTSP